MAAAMMMLLPVVMVLALIGIGTLDLAAQADRAMRVEVTTA